ncbi:MAG: radical SAM protein [Bdellovibrionota bacterium]
MRIFLINPPTNYDDPYPWVEPLGIGYIAAACRDAGHEVRIRDLCYTTMDAVSRVFGELDEFRPDLVGLTAMTENFKNGLEIARAVKSRYGCPVVFGGWHVSGEPQAVLDPAIDYVVRGEGEDTILELLEYLQDKGPALSEINGIAYKEGGVLRLTAPRTRIKKLARLPVPVREGLSLENYKYLMLFSQPISRMRTLSVQASRGCPYTCVFCQTPAVWSNVWTKRTASSVVDEIEELAERHAANTFVFRDEEFTVRPNWVVELCEEMIRRGIPRRLSWGAFVRVDDAVPEMVKAMKAAGCSYVLMGIEVSDEEQAKKIKKFYKREEAERAFRLYYNADIFAQGSWVVGFPWDTLESLERSFEWILTLEMDSLTMAFATPFAATPLREYVDRHGLLLTQDTNAFTLHEPVIRTPEIPLETLRKLPAWYRRRFYFRPAQMARLARKIVRDPRRVRIVAELLYDRVFKAKLFSYMSPDRRRRDWTFKVPGQYFEPLKQVAAPTGDSTTGPRALAV